MAVRSTLLISSLALALFMTGPASAQSGSSDAARLKRLENEVETLSRALYKGEAPPPGAYAPDTSGVTANMEVRLSTMEATVRELTGRLEEQQHATRQMQERLDRVLSELDRRMVDVETKVRGGAAAAVPGGAYPTAGYSDAGDPPMPSWAGGTAAQPMDAGDLTRPYDGSAMAGPTGLNTGAGAVGGMVDGMAPLEGAAANGAAGQLGELRQNPVTGQASLPVAGDSPAAFYEQAFALLRDRNYEGAGTAFAAFLERWPDHELATNAQYWMGESWYVRNDFERAARIFAEAYQKNPKGPKAPDNLLKLALSLNGMGKKKEGCLTLAQLEKDFGAINSPIVARAKQESGKIGCGT